MEPKPQSSARRRAEARHLTLPTDQLPGVASDYLEHFAKLVRAGAVTAAVLTSRVSGRNQKRNKNLNDQAEGLRLGIAEFDVPVIASFKEVAAGWRWDDRPGLDAAIEAARANGPGTVVVATSTGRYVRHRDYNGTKSAWPTVADFEALKQRAGEVVLATLLVPDAPFEAVRWYEQHQGQVAKADVGGRPPKVRLEYKRNYKEAHGIAKLTWALRLGYVAKKEIARFYGRKPSTIRGWVKQWEKRWGRPWPQGGEF